MLFPFQTNRSAETEDYMQIPMSPSQTGGSEPPRPPPLPPPFIAPPSNTNGMDTNGQTSKTNTINSTNGIPVPPMPPQDTATRKQQQPLSAISISDLNSVQVNNIFRFFLNFLLFKHLFNENCSLWPSTASSHRKTASKDIFNTDAKHEHAMFIIDKRIIFITKNRFNSRIENVKRHQWHTQNESRTRQNGRIVW